MKPKFPPLLMERIFLWPILMTCYAELGLLAYSHVTKQASGVVAIGFVLAIVVGVPTLVGFAGFFWRNDLIHGFVRWEVLACMAFPLLLIPFGLLAFSAVLP